MAEVILLCAQQDIGLRGHRESQSSLNRGNFLEILSLVASHDTTVQERLLCGPRNAVYTSPDIQNSLLNVMANMVRKKICNAVREAGVFSLLADESKDCSKQEQLAIILRYVDDKAIIHENFLTYVQATSLTAESLAAYLVDTLRECQLDPESIVSQGYDGASVMSGRCSGVQQRLREFAPHAIYIHCYAHTLNLVLVDCAKVVQSVREFFCLLEQLYVFVSTTKAHVTFMAKQNELHPGKQPLQLQALSDTRWACRYGAVNAVCRTYDCILATLREVGNGSDSTKAVEARGLCHQVAAFPFLVSLVMFDRILSCTKSLSDHLQSTQIDLAGAANLVNATKETLEDYRSDSMWNKVYEYAKSVAELHGIQVAVPTSARKRRLPKRFEECVLLQSTGCRESVPSSEEYKRELYFPVVDAFLSELRRRFDDKNMDVMCGIQACNPHSKNFLSLSVLMPLAEMYSFDKEVLEMEVKLVKRTLETKELEHIGDVFLALVSLKAAFPEFTKLVRIAMTIAVSTAHCERSFSALKRIKNYLRSTMGENRLMNLAIISIERELSNTLVLDDVVTEFAGLDQNRRIVLV